mgnify:CR=1 FL=1
MKKKIIVVVVLVILVLGGYAVCKATQKKETMLPKISYYYEMHISGKLIISIREVGSLWISTIISVLKRWIRLIK